jgi:rod shape-determining protein MreC
VVAVLVAASLVLITLSFRSTALDRAQGAGVSVLRPFEIAATRVAQPFHDASDWTQGLFHAKSENRRLTREVEALRREVAGLAAARQGNAYLERLLHYQRAPAFPQDAESFDQIVAQVLTSPTLFDQTITIAAGSTSGIRPQDVVLTPDGLVGTVTKVFGSVSRVMLLTADASGVRATDERDQSAVGTLQRGSTDDALALTRVGKDKRVEQGDTIVTAGSPGEGELPSLFPANIPIGVVTSVGQNETDIFKQIQVQPFVDFSSLQSVIVLVPKPTAPPRAHRR